MLHNNDMDTEETMRQLPEYDYTVRVRATDEEAADHFMREALGGYGNVAYGHKTATGRLLTDADFERLADETERGHPDAR
jgi:hypothetical protein